MIEAKDCVVWTNDQTKTVIVTGSEVSRRHLRLEQEGLWCDPIGAAYAQWRKMTDEQRANLMVETALDLTLKGYDLGDVVREFAKVDCFYVLGRVSHPMCRVLTSALLGQCLEPNTMSFDELMAHYRPLGEGFHRGEQNYLRDGGHQHDPA